MPRVSVVIPAYNPGGLLARALESVLAQTMADLECLVIDDGSPQDLAWVRDVADPRVRYVRQANRGVSVARNVGVRLARADHVAFLDQDDEWLPTKIERQVEALAAAPEAAFCHTGFEWVLPGGPAPEVHERAVTYRGLLADQHVCLSSVLVSRDAYAAAGGHDPLLVQMQDYDLFLRLTMDSPPPVAVREVLVRYHVHGANVSADYASAARERLALLAAHASRARRRGDGAALAACEAGVRRTRELFGLQALERFRAGVRERDVRASLPHLGFAARMDPLLVARGAGQALARRAREVRPGRAVAPSGEGVTRAEGVTPSDG